jgi:hypothetical protein
MGSILPTRWICGEGASGISVWKTLTISAGWTRLESSAWKWSGAQWRAVWAGGRALARGRRRGGPTQRRAREGAVVGGATIDDGPPLSRSGPRLRAPCSRSGTLEAMPPAPPSARATPAPAHRPATSQKPCAGTYSSVGLEEKRAAVASALLLLRDRAAAAKPPAPDATACGGNLTRPGPRPRRRGRRAARRPTCAGRGAAAT